VIGKLISYITLFACTQAFGQDNGFKLYTDAIETPRSENDYRIAFYNCENLFDLKDDSLTRDESFTPEGSYKYTFGRYKKKSNGIAKTIAALGGWRPAEIVGLCEVENYWVLEGLTKYSPIENIGYKIIHQESPDRRGIDIACIYDPDRFNVILYRYYRVNFPFDKDRTTRDILYVKGIISPSSDTLHVFFNHWPSRYGGQFASEPSRKFVADLLRSKVDSLNERFDNPLIAIAGDFNDEPDDLSMQDHLKVKRPTDRFKSNELVNLMFPVKYNYGTHSYAGEWGVLDQFIVSGSLLKNTSFFTKSNWVGIFNAPWLLKKNAANHDVPHRTFQGPAYKGGYSDHIPIFLDLQIGEKQKSAP